MATITGLTAARMAAIEAASIVDGEVVGDNLILTRNDTTTINAGNVRGPVAPYPSIVASLPSSPSDLDEIYFQDAAMAAAKVVWHAKYRSGIGKWEVLGGNPLVSEVTTGESRSANTYGALTTAGPSIAVPVAGVYDVEIFCGNTTSVGSQSGAAMSYDIGGTSASDADAAWNQVISPGFSTPAYRKRRKTLTAVTLTAKYKSPNSVVVSWQERSMFLHPVLLG